MGLRDIFQREKPTSVAANVGKLPAPPSQLPPPPTQYLHWVPFGEVTSVGGRAINGGGVYVGRQARAADGSRVEPALLEPSLSVDWDHPDWPGNSMGYWPSYSTISPGSRSAYLSWLNSDRAHPDTYIGYVFLYFYGLERRALLDAEGSWSHPDVPGIVKEVRRLLDTYGSNHSFNSYATGFLSLLEASTFASTDLMPPDASTFEGTWEVPLVVKVALGRYVAAEQPIPVDWALLWLRTYPEAYLRTPATRCRHEFNDLFNSRYRSRFGEGLLIKAPKATISVDYRTASAGFSRVFHSSMASLPDATSLKGPINRLKELGTECTDALDSYSRYVGRHPEEGNSPQAVALLPSELVDLRGGEAVASLRSWIHSIAGTVASVVALKDLMEHWSPGHTAKLVKAEAVALASLLGKLGVGMEPDVRFGASTPHLNSSVALFLLPAGATAAPTAQYASAAMLVQLTAVVAAADGAVTDDERRHLAQYLHHAFDLDQAERIRLDARLIWLIEAKSGLAGLKKRVDDLDRAHREAIARFLLEIAAADGVISPSEISMLTNIYALLGLEESDLFSAIHAIAIPNTGPTLVRPASFEDPRWRIPDPPSEPRGEIRLDPEKVRARVAETATVTALLASIFTEDEEASAPIMPIKVPPSDPDSPRLPGLDGPHSHLAELLHDQTSWTRSAAEAKAAECGLPMIDAAIDRINEVAIDICEEPLLEGDDPLEVNAYAVRELFHV